MLRTLSLLLLLATPGMAHDVTAGDLQIIHPVLFKPFDASRTAGGYMAVSNEGAEADTLIGARVEGVMAMIHESREEGGIAKMVHLDAVEIPAGDTVNFERGGLHVMLMGLKPGQFKPGDTVGITLIFDRAGEVTVPFTVEEGAGGHEGHMNN